MYQIYMYIEIIIVKTISYRHHIDNTQSLQIEADPGDIFNSRSLVRDDQISLRATKNVQLACPLGNL